MEIPVGSTWLYFDLPKTQWSNQSFDPDHNKKIKRKTILKNLLIFSLYISLNMAEACLSLVSSKKTKTTTVSNFVFPQYLVSGETVPT